MNTNYTEVRTFPRPLYFGQNEETTQILLKSNTMALYLEHKSGMLHVTGELHGSNSNTLIHHFESFLNEMDSIILSLENVSYLDDTAAYSLEQIYQDFAKSNRVIQIIGRCNKEIMETFRETNTSYILSHDRI